MGTKITVTVTADQGYSYVDGSLKMNGVAIASNSFTMPAGDVQLSAEFKQNVPNGGRFDVTLTQTKYIYTGKVIQPVFVVKDSKIGAVLQINTDYTVSITSGKNAGNYQVTVNGIGAYSGTITKTYTIEKATKPITVKKNSYNYTFSMNRTIQLSPSVTGKESLKYKSTNKKVATVDSKGKNKTQCDEESRSTFEKNRTDNSELGKRQ